MRGILLAALLGAALLHCGESDGAGGVARDGGVDAPFDAAQDAPEVRDASPGDGGAPPVCPNTEDYAALEEHSCFHREHGPRTTITATAPGGAPPDVSAAHTELTIVLPAASGGHAGIVKYTARKSRPYIAYADIDVPIAVTGESGNIAPACAGTAIGKCAGLTRATKFPLTAGQTYQLALGPVASAQVVLVIEEIEFEDP